MDGSSSPPPEDSMNAASGNFQSQEFSLILPAPSTPSGKNLSSGRRRAFPEDLDATRKRLELYLTRHSSGATSDGEGSAAASRRSDQRILGKDYSHLPGTKEGDGQGGSKPQHRVSTYQEDLAIARALSAQHLGSDKNANQNKIAQRRELRAQIENTRQFLTTHPEHNLPLATANAGRAGGPRGGRGAYQKEVEKTVHYLNMVLGNDGFWRKPQRAAGRTSPTAARSPKTGRASPRAYTSDGSGTLFRGDSALLTKVNEMKPAPYEGPRVAADYHRIRQQNQSVLSGQRSSPQPQGSPSQGSPNLADTTNGGAAGAAATMNGKGGGGGGQWERLYSLTENPALESLINASDEKVFSPSRRRFFAREICENRKEKEARQRKEATLLSTSDNSVSESQRSRSPSFSFRGATRGQGGGVHHTAAADGQTEFGWLAPVKSPTGKRHQSMRETSPPTSSTKDGKPRGRGVVDVSRPTASSKRKKTFYCQTFFDDHGSINRDLSDDDELPPIRQGYGYIPEEYKKKVVQVIADEQLARVKSRQLEGGAHLGSSVLQSGSGVFTPSRSGSIPFLDKRSASAPLGASGMAESRKSLATGLSSGKATGPVGSTGSGAFSYAGPHHELATKAVQVPNAERIAELTRGEFLQAGNISSFLRKLEREAKQGSLRSDAVGRSGISHSRLGGSSPGRQ